MPVHNKGLLNDVLINKSHYLL